MAAAAAASSGSDTGTTGSDTGGLKGTGYSEGDIAHDLVGTDQSGSPWSLHDRYGTAVLLLVGHMYDNDVTQMMDVERYSHVMHLVSHVTGRLRDGYTNYDALRACFPAGTVSGAPKIRAMEIIAELEPDKRGPYSGAVGYFDLSGNMDTAITIRTLVIKDGVAYAQAGGGIVFDSNPEAEYQETLHKASALIRAIEEAEANT